MNGLVKIKTWDRMEKEFGLRPSTGSIDCRRGFTEEMEKGIPPSRTITAFNGYWNGFMLSDDMVAKPKKRNTPKKPFHANKGYGVEWKQEPDRLLFNLHNCRYIMTVRNERVFFPCGFESSCSASSWLDGGAIEIEEADLPYLKEPEGDWAFRKAVIGDEYIAMQNVFAGDMRHHPVTDICNENSYPSDKWLSGYRWCKPTNKHAGTTLDAFTQEEFQAEHAAVMEMLDEHSR